MNKKISQLNKQLTELIDFTLSTPRVMMDYCYRDECITSWKREEIIQRVNGLEALYHCRGCGTKRHYRYKDGELREYRG